MRCQAPLVVFGLFVAPLFFAGCDDRPPDRGGPSEPVGESEPAAIVPSAETSAGLALTYEPQPGPAEERIAAALAAVREAPSVGATIELAHAFIERRRQTHDDRYALYAESAVEAALAEVPNDPTAHAAAALLRLDQHRFDEAAGHAERAVELAPGDATGNLLLGDALLEQGRYEAATEAYQQAMELSPDLRTYNRGSYMRWLYGDEDGAFELARMALDAGSLDPTAVAWCLTDIADMHWHAGRSELGLGAIYRALEIDPRNRRARLMRARLLAQSGDTRAAATAYEAILDGQASAEALLELADLLDSLGQREDARRRVANAAELTREDPLSLVVYNARRNLEPERTLRLAEASLQTHATIAAWDAFALAAWRAGRLDDARQASDRALALGTQDARLYLHRAHIEQAAGQPEAARAQLERALEINPRVDPELVAELRRVLPPVAETGSSTSARN